jgi:processive 1,2-diacylglycerol beta-glucosyltransferase
MSLDMKNNELWILHASVGGGHKSAARALERALALREPGQPVRVIDALDGMTDEFRRLYTGSFEAGVAHTPTFYGAFFELTKELDRSAAFRAARTLHNRAHGQRLLEMIRLGRPRAIVCTHFLPLEMALVERRRGRLDAPIFGVVTDYVAHGLWRQPDADLTFCPPGRGRHDLKRGGVPGRRIVVSGIPIDPVFAQPYDQVASKRAAGLALERPTVAVLAGGAGMGPLVEVLEHTARAVGASADLVVVCGKNEVLKARAARAARDLPGRVRVVGFVDPIVELLRGADVVVTKPGGLTTSECLALGKPTVFYEAAPGQESANARFAADQGAGVHGGTPAATAAEAARLVRDPAARATLAARARRIGRGDAAVLVADTVLAEVGRYERQRERARARARALVA